MWSAADESDSLCKLIDHDAISLEVSGSESPSENRAFLRVGAVHTLWLGSSTQWIVRCLRSLEYLALRLLLAVTVTVASINDVHVSRPVTQQLTQAPQLRQKVPWADLRYYHHALNDCLSRSLSGD